MRTSPARCSCRRQGAWDRHSQRFHTIVAQPARTRETERPTRANESAAPRVAAVRVSNLRRCQERSGKATFRMCLILSSVSRKLLVSVPGRPRSHSDGPSTTVTPIARRPPAVHHREDENVSLGLNRIENGVREYMREATSNILFNFPPTFWSLQNAANRALDGGDETQIKPFLTIGVIMRGVRKLL